MESTSVAVSRHAAHRHARTVAGGPPRSARWTAPAAGVSAGAAVALPLLRPAALALAAMAVLLLAVHREDRRNAWRFSPAPVAPARFLPPLRRLEQAPVTNVTAPAQPATLVVAAVHVPTQVVPLPSIPKSRAAVVQVGPGKVPQGRRTTTSPTSNRLPADRRTSCPSS